MNLKYWLTHPGLLFHRIRYWIWEKSNPDKPWMCPGTIRFCQKHFADASCALEFGSGRSTRWFASLAKQLTSVEHSAEWYPQVQKQLQQAGITNVDYRFLPLSHPESEPERATYDPTPDYVLVADTFPDASLDFVIVDGHYRTNCIRHSIPKIRPGGYLLIDDINLWPSVADLPIPSTWKIVDDSTNGMKRCLIWQASQGKVP